MLKFLTWLASLYSSVGEKFSITDRQPVTSWTLMLPGSGCAYWKKTGGCSMCGFSNSTKRYTGGLLYPSLFFRSLYRLAEKQTYWQQPAEILIFNGGSFLNPEEIPSDFQLYLYRKVAEHNSLKKLFIESRCEYISEEKIGKAIEHLDGKRLAVGIGLESQDDFVRNKIIKKGLLKKVFEKKVGLLRKLGAEVVAYVFLKPMWLSEREAFLETMNTIRYALSVGVTEIELSCAFVQEGTEMARAFHTNNYQPPYLWTIMEIVKEVVKNNWPVNIGKFTDEPVPIAIPANCPGCSPLIYRAIDKFRETRNLAVLPECGCKADWERMFFKFSC